MKCAFDPDCNSPKKLCCNYCSKKQCENRCKCDSSSCELFYPEVSIEDDDFPYLSKKPLREFINKECVPIKTDSGLFMIINKKQGLKLCKNKYMKYYALKECPSKYEIVKTTKNKAQKKADELNKKLSRNYWSVEEC